MRNGRRTGACLHCTHEGEIAGRGLCPPCYYKLKRRGELDAYPAMLLLPPEQRLAQLALLGETACWPWPTRINEHGYGHAGHRGLAHRWVWELTYGPIPDGREVDHMCHNIDPACAGGRTCFHRRCVNPRHLRVVSRQLNGWASSHTLTGQNVRKTHCPQGHPYDVANTYFPPCNGHRQCRACMDDRNANRPSRALGLPRPRKSHCVHGHPFDEANTYITPSTGSRQCRACIARRNAARSA